jgi:transglutaminase-like putative cysteine protease
MRRRELLMGLTGVTATAFSKPSAISEPLDISMSLAPTRYLDFEHKAVRAAIVEASDGATTDKERAVGIFNFVRDRVRFGWDGRFYDMRASEVLNAGIGYCNTKSTLFCAMLRGAGIPARQHFVDISARILDGLLAPGTPFVDHSFVEVDLNGRTHAVDAYIVDRSLFDAARARLVSEKRSLGYGVHRDGACDWDGETDAFSQFVRTGADPAPTTRDYGVYADVGDFYRRGSRWNRLNVALRLGIPLFIPGPNARAQALRGVDPD